jgi:O-acetylhomoserine (thiol)-lyase
MNDEQLIAAGVPADLMRLSVGIEDVSDIISDIENALTKVM